MHYTNNETMEKNDMKRPEFTYDEAILLFCLYFEFNFLDFNSINKERLKYRISVYSRIFRILNAHNIIS